jgi:hypothetical protein
MLPKKLMLNKNSNVVMKHFQTSQVYQMCKENFDIEEYE